MNQNPGNVKRAVFEFRIMQKLLVAVFLLFFTLNASAQDAAVSGTVTGDNGYPTCCRQRND